MFLHHLLGHVPAIICDVFFSHSRCIRVGYLRVDLRVASYIGIYINTRYGDLGLNFLPFFDFQDVTELIAPYDIVMFLDRVVLLDGRFGRHITK